VRRVTWCPHGCVRASIYTGLRFWHVIPQLDVCYILYLKKALKDLVQSLHNSLRARY